MKIKSKHIITLLLIFTISLMTGCTKSKSAPNDISSDRLKVYTTFYPLYDFTMKIASENADVKNMIPTGVEPHDFEPSPKQVAKLEGADVFIYLSETMEPWAEKMKNSLEEKGVLVVKAGENLEKNKDPHIWLDPILAQEISKNIKDALEKVDNENKAIYGENFSILKNQFQKLHKKYLDTLSNVKHREIITSHDAFGYMAERYGLIQIPIKGILPQEEPSPWRMAELSKLCREKNIKYIFLETLASPKLSETLAREVGAETLVLNPIAGLTPDDEKRGEDYFSLMEKNLENLAKALKE